jgi:dipeptidyl aminopeptidase/acylaminoacyl peptidase
MIRRVFPALCAWALVSPALAAGGQASAAPAAAPAAAPRPVEDFTALPFMERPKLSPDGTKIAALVAIKGKQYFAIMPLVGRAEPKFVPSTTDVNWWSWVNNDWLVVGIGAMDRFEGEDVYIRRAIGVRADAGKIVPLTGTDMGLGDDVLWIADDGSPRIRLALQKTIYQMPEVVEVDVSTGRSKQIVAPHNDILGWYADSQGTVRLGIGLVKDGRSSRLYYRNRDTENFRIIDRANTRDMIVPSLFLPERDQALAIDDADGFQAVYKLDLKTMKLGERVFGVPGYDVGGIVEDRESPRMLGVSVVENAPKTYWMDPAIAQVQAALDKAAGSRRAQIVSFSRDRTVFLVHIGAPDRPGSYYVMAGDGKLPRLADVNARIGTGKLNPVRTIRYKARDGLEIAAVLTLPAGRPAKGLPVIVMPHGGPFARDAESWDWWSQFLAERGYAVIQPNFRGSAGYGTAFAKKGQGQWGLAMQDDLNDALAHLVKEGIADRKRACMVGASYGGYAAMRAA